MRKTVIAISFICDLFSIFVLLCVENLTALIVRSALNVCAWHGLIIIKFINRSNSNRLFNFDLNNDVFSLEKPSGFFYVGINMSAILNDRDHRELSTFLRNRYSWSRVRLSSCAYYWPIGRVSDRTAVSPCRAFSSVLKHHHRDASLIIGLRLVRRYVRAYTCIYVCIHAPGASPGDCQSNHGRARYSRHSRRSVVAREVHVAWRNVEGRWKRYACTVDLSRKILCQLSAPSRARFIFCHHSFCE